MNLYLDALTRDDCQRARAWRNEGYDVGNLRTAKRLTEADQDVFYDRLRQPGCPHRYFAVRIQPTGWVDETSMYSPAAELVAMAGLVDISPENGTAEISLIVSPDCRGKGMGREAVRLVLVEAFDRLRILSVYGECYNCNPPEVLRFWQRLVNDWGGYDACLPARKFWNGRQYSSFYFGWLAEAWRERAR
ncbi:MAG: GNAT family N-acetyltransferase [Acidobacteria bacterium]|nr:GNAT family N-acetyltransferase [Acidobacteriota bacterium]